MFSHFAGFTIGFSGVVNVGPDLFSLSPRSFRDEIFSLLAPKFDDLFILATRCHDRCLVGCGGHRQKKRKTQTLHNGADGAATNIWSKRTLLAGTHCLVRVGAKVLPHKQICSQQLVSGFEKKFTIFGSFCSHF